MQTEKDPGGDTSGEQYHMEASVYACREMWWLLPTCFSSLCPYERRHRRSQEEGSAVFLALIKPQNIDELIYPGCCHGLKRDSDWSQASQH